MQSDTVGRSKHQVVSRYGGMSIRVHHFAKAGDKHYGHVHKIDHVTILGRGAVHVVYSFPDGSTDERSYKAPALIEIDRDVYHQLTALEDDTMYFCAFSEWGPVDDATGLPRQLDHITLMSIQDGICSTCSGSGGCGAGIVPIDSHMKRSA